MRSERQTGSSNSLRDLAHRYGRLLARHRERLLVGAAREGADLP